MKSIFILIIMFMPEFGMYPDSVKVSSHEGNPLRFATLDSCEEYVNKHWKGLEEFGMHVYPEASAVKKILCIVDE